MLLSIVLVAAVANGLDAAAFVPFATAIVGFVIEGAGSIPTIVGLGIVYVAVTLGILLNPALPRMDAAPPTVATS